MDGREKLRIFEESFSGPRLVSATARRHGISNPLLFAWRKAYPRGFAGPNLLAMILFEKFGQHQPLNRQSDRYPREGIDLSVSTLANQARHLTSQNDQMPENRILCLKSTLRLEWRGQGGQDEAEPEHGPHTLGDSFGQ